MAHPELRRVERFMLGFTIGSYVGRRMVERHKLVGEWTTPRARGYLMVAVLFIGSLAASTAWPQKVLWLTGGALFIGEGIRRGYMSWYARRHCV
jgi:hypothetical protein